jgi:membrane protease YdiL (CAAX protease family)
MPESRRRPAIVRQVVLLEGGLILVALLLGHLSGNSPVAAIAWTWSGLLAGILAAIPLVVLLFWSRRTMMQPFPRLRRDFERLVAPMFRGTTRLDYLVIALAAALGEEVFFRGLVQPGLANWIGPWSALLLTSVLFGAAHWIAPTYSLLATLAGIYLGGFMLVSGNLLVPMIVHFLYDYVALAVVMKRPMVEGGGVAGGETGGPAPDGTGPP